MSTNTNDSDSTVDEEQEDIDPRLESNFGSRFEDTDLEVDELGEVLAEMHDDQGFHHVLAYHAKTYIENNYEVDPNTLETLKELLAKRALSGLFPYRNAIVTAEMVDIRTGDRVYKKQTAWNDEDRDHVVKEYEVDRIQDHGTDLILEERVYYDLEGNVVAEPRKKDSLNRKHLDPNTAQVEHDDAWYVQRLNRDGESDE